MMATGYFAKYGLSFEEGKKLLSMIDVKNHHNGSLNPKAHFQREITMEQAMKAPMVAYPLGLYDCCGVSDGAAAAIITRADIAAYKEAGITDSRKEISIAEARLLLHHGTHHHGGPAVQPPWQGLRGHRGGHLRS